MGGLWESRWELHEIILSPLDPCGEAILSTMFPDVPCFSLSLRLLPLPSGPDGLVRAAKRLEPAERRRLR